MTGITRLSLTAGGVASYGGGTGYILPNEYVIVCTTGGFQAYSDNPLTTGSYYFEVTVPSANFFIGVCNPSTITSAASGSTTGYAVIQGSNGGIYVNGSYSGTSLGNSYSTILCIAVDIDTKLIWFRVNSGNWNNSSSANPATGTGGISISSLTGSIVPVFWIQYDNNAYDATVVNFGQNSFAETAPSGFSNWPGISYTPAHYAVYKAGEFLVSSPPYSVRKAGEFLVSSPPYSVRKAGEFIIQNPSDYVIKQVEYIVSTAVDAVKKQVEYIVTLDVGVSVSKAVGYGVIEPVSSAALVSKITSYALIEPPWKNNFVAKAIAYAVLVAPQVEPINETVIFCCM